MTEEQLREIEARAEKATPGPWHACPCNKCGLVGSPGDGDSIICDTHGWREDCDALPPNPSKVPDHYFIAAARTDVPELVAAYRELRALAADLAADLIDCIDEVESKAYLKGYVRVGYDETLARARAAGLLKAQG